MAIESPATDALRNRLAKLGLETDELPTDEFCSATAALCCLPMYMVANVPAWATDAGGQSRIRDLLGVASLRAAMAIGDEEAGFDIRPEHSETLHQLLSASKATDRIVYEYALDTLAELLEKATPDFADAIRTSIARGVVTVAQASGEGWFGTGDQPSLAHRRCIQQIIVALKLKESPAAAEILERLDH